MVDVIPDPAAAMAASTHMIETGIKLANTWVVPGLLRVLGALAIFVVGAMASTRLARLVDYATQRVKLDPTLGGVLASIVRYAVLIFTFIAVLNKFGVDTAAFIAVMGAAGLAIGLSLQGTLSNVAAGALLLLIRPFRVGETVRVGATNEGVVQRIDLFATELLSSDGTFILVPNGAVWGSVIINYTHTPTRAVNVKFAIAADADVSKAIATLETVAKADSRFVGAGAAVSIDKLGWSYVELAVAGQVNNADYNSVVGAIRQKGFFALRDAAIAAPNPTIDDPK